MLQHTSNNITESSTTNDRSIDTNSTDTQQRSEMTMSNTSVTTKLVVMLLMTSGVNRLVVVVPH